MTIPAHSGFVGLCVDLTFALLGQTLCERAVHRRLAYKGVGALEFEQVAENRLTISRAKKTQCGLCLRRW